MSNGLDSDQDRCSVCPDLDPNCLQMLSADDKSRPARKESVFFFQVSVLQFNVLTLGLPDQN